MKTKNLPLHVAIKLHATHHDHIDVISAHLQDTLVKADSLLHSEKQKTFKLLGNRFCWEHFLNPEDPIKLRVHAGVHFNHVTKVQKKNIHLHHPDKLYNLMTIRSQPNEVTLKFSEHAEIKLTVDQISCKLADLHDPYPTQFLPNHSESKL